MACTCLHVVALPSPDPPDAPPPPERRQMVADAVMADPVQWDEAMLGKPPAEYCTWIKVGAGCWVLVEGGCRV